MVTKSDIAAVMRALGSRGGLARARKLSPERRLAIAVKASRAAKLALTNRKSDER